MSESLTDVYVTDIQLDAIGARGYDGSGDLVLAELAALAAAVDLLPFPPAAETTSTSARPKSTRAHKGGWALTVTVALLVTSSGVAAAVSDDPLGPLHYVTEQVWRIGPHNDGRLPGWDLNGAMPISTVPRHLVSRSGAGRPVAGGGGTTTYAVGDGVGGSTPRGGTPGGGSPPSTGSGAGSTTGAGGSIGSSTPGTGSGGGTAPGTPTGGTGQTPGRSSGGQTPGHPGSGDPGLPANPVRSGHGNHRGDNTNQGYGRLPGSSSGHCGDHHLATPGTHQSSGDGRPGAYGCGKPAPAAPPRSARPVTPVAPVAPAAPAARTPGAAALTPKASHRHPSLR